MKRSLLDCFVCASTVVVLSASVGCESMALQIIIINPDPSNRLGRNRSRDRGSGSGIAREIAVCTQLIRNEWKIRFNLSRKILSSNFSFIITIFVSVRGL